MTDSARSEKGKRDRLVAAARELIHRQGIEKTTIADIARAADVPAGNVYYYFKTKDDLIEAAIAGQTPRHSRTARLARALPHATSPAQGAHPRPHRPRHADRPLRLSAREPLLGARQTNRRPRPDWRGDASTPDRLGRATVLAHWPPRRPRSGGRDDRLLRGRRAPHEYVPCPSWLARRAGPGRAIGPRTPTGVQACGYLRVRAERRRRRSQVRQPVARKFSAAARADP
jgi:AcrR family transcriptional regulator